jgi:hypothetical protein
MMKLIHLIRKKERELSISIVIKRSEMIDDKGIGKCSKQRFSKSYSLFMTD